MGEIGNRIGGGLAAMLMAERQRWPLWLPVLMGAGVAAYFAWPGAPPGWPSGPAGLVLAALLGAFALRRRGAALALLIPALLLAGFAAAGVRTAAVGEPVLARKHGPATVIGRVIQVEPRATGVRAVLEDPDVAGLESAATPRRVRLVVRAPGDVVVPGAVIRVRAVLMPPPRPAAPGAHDFGRALYFQGIGAVGYAVSRAEAVAASEAGGWRQRLAALRLTVAGRIDAAIVGDGDDGGDRGRQGRAAVAVALLTGLRGGIPADVNTAMRRAGLAHLLAISGLHLGLVAGLVFFTLRLLFAAIEPLALFWPIKKWAALAALFAAFFYLMLTGATVPTQRAFVMAGLVLLAVLIDREAISMRPVALAALVVLALRPESLLGVSFQMSFAAVVALVAFYEVAWRRWPPAGAASPWRRPALYVGAVVATTLVASAATAPFAAYHFGRVATLGLIANLVAVPITALWIMPWGVLALLLMPFGLEAMALAPMDWGIAAVIAVARVCAELPWAVTLVAAWPPATAALIAIGGLWLCLWRRPWRWAGVGAIVAGLLVAAAARPPDVLVSEDGALFGVRAGDGRLALSRLDTARFEGDIWLRRAGQATSAPWPAAGEAWPGESLRCDRLGCLYRPSGRATVALVGDARALADDCAAATVVVSAVPVRGACGEARVVIDRFDLWRHGAHAVWLGEDGGVRIRSAAWGRRGRPWARDLSSGE